MIKNTRKRIILDMVVLLLLITTGIFLLFMSRNGEVTVTIDEANDCSGGGMTKVMSSYVKVKVRKDKYDTYVKEARESGVCIVNSNGVQW